MQHHNLKPLREAEWSVEILRGLAAIMVVFAHYYAPETKSDHWLLKFMFTGVDLFFVISGFVFAPYFFGNKIKVVPYFIKRFFRIYPLYVVAIVVYALIRVFNNQEVSHVAKHLLFLHTTQTIEIASYFNLAFWTLPPEVEFYCAIPLLCAVATGFRFSLLLTFAALVIHFVTRYFFPLTAGLNGAVLINFHLPAYLFEFMLGTMVWYLVRNISNVRARLALIATGVVLWLIFAYNYGNNEPGSDVIEFFRSHPWTFAAISFFFMTTGWIGLIKEPHPLLKKLAIFLGDISFGVYLFHNAFPRLLQGIAKYLPTSLFMPLCFVCTLAFAFVMHRLCESPLRDYGRRLAARHDAMKLSPA